MEILNETTRTSKVPVYPETTAGAQDSTLKAFFTRELKYVYWAEQQLVKTLPKMAAASTSSALSDLFTKHLAETKQHVTRLEKAFSLLGISPDATVCQAMAGITEAGEMTISDTPEGTATRDVALVLAAQKAEHHEIATYGGLAQVAQLLGLMEIAGLLNATLDEEKGADKMLSLAASSNINRAAAIE